MTKKRLVELLKPFPDDAEIEIYCEDDMRLECQVNLDDEFIVYREKRNIVEILG